MQIGFIICIKATLVSLISKQYIIICENILGMTKYHESYFM